VVLVTVAHVLTEIGRTCRQDLLFPLDMSGMALGDSSLYFFYQTKKLPPSHPSSPNKKDLDLFPKEGRDLNRVLMPIEHRFFPAT